MRFLAIDFETANAKRSSICAFGYALFEEGSLVTSGVDLCKPEPNYYDFWNTRIHGITYEDTCLLGGFEDLVQKIDAFWPDFIVAHNASFDISCLRSWCDSRGYVYPDYPYICTVVTSRSLHANMSHALDAMCRLYDIPLNHHEAGSDAMACGLLMQKFLQMTHSTSADSLCQTLGISMGKIRRTPG